jgi:hypothetical protein
MVVEEREYEMRQQTEIENASLAESLPNLTWMLLLNKGMLSHEPKGEKSKTDVRLSFSETQHTLRLSCSHSS